jgi:hypothetical protein
MGFRWTLLVALGLNSCFLLTGCCKKTVDTSTVLTNNSGETLSITSYFKSGSQGNISIENGSINKSGNNDVWIVLAENDLFYIDSLIVKYGNKKTTIHYGEGVQGNTVSALEFGSPRNLLNEVNYRKNIITDKKCSYIAEYHYAFIPEDAR